MRKEGVCLVPGKVRGVYLLKRKKMGRIRNEAEACSVFAHTPPYAAAATVGVALQREKIKVIRIEWKRGPQRRVADVRGP